MTNEQFEEALSRYGGDFKKWPAAMRLQAEALVAKDVWAARMLADAMRLDRLIAEAARPTPVDAALIGAIIAGIGNGRHHDVAVRPTGRLAAWSGAAVAVFLAIGFAIGLALPADQGEDALVGLMFGSDAGASIIIADGDGLL
jgi:hypothetical protein